MILNNFIIKVGRLQFMTFNLLVFDSDNMIVQMLNTTAEKKSIKHIRNYLLINSKRITIVALFISCNLASNSVLSLISDTPKTKIREKRLQFTK